MKESKAKDQACVACEGNKNIKPFSKTKQAKPKCFQNQNVGILKFCEYFKGVVGFPRGNKFPTIFYIFLSETYGIIGIDGSILTSLREITSNSTNSGMFINMMSSIK